MALRLLLASKDGETDRVFREAVSSVGAEVNVSRSLDPAMRSIRDEKFDAIFADAQLPGLTRWDLTRVVRGSKFNSLAPLILLTDYADPSKSKDVTLMVKPSKAASLIPLLKDLKRKLTVDRRKQRRLSYLTDVNCVASLKRFHAQSVNLSAVGMLLEGTLPYGRGEEFEVSLQLETADPVFRARVRVVRIDSAKRTALAFQNLGVMERQRLRRFLDRHLPPP